MHSIMLLKPPSTPIDMLKISSLLATSYSIGVPYFAAFIYSLYIAVLANESSNGDSMTPG